MRAANVLSFVRGQTANGGALALFRQLNGIRFYATNHPSDEKFHVSETTCLIVSNNNTTHTHTYAHTHAHAHPHVRARARHSHICMPLINTENQ